MKVAFTGHRPDKLPGGYNWFNYENVELRKSIGRVLVNLIDSFADKEFTFYSGGALGFDANAFYCVEKVKEIYRIRRPDIIIRNVLCLPCMDQGSRWNYRDKMRLEQDKEIADEVVYVDETDGYIKFERGFYHPYKMILRDHYMIDRLDKDKDILISCYNGDKSGGTYKTIMYANSKHIKNINLWR